MYRNPLICIEGVDASGKASVVGALVAALCQEGHHATSMAFPVYGNTTGKAVLGHLKGEWQATPMPPPALHPRCGKPLRRVEGEWMCDTCWVRNIKVVGRAAEDAPPITLDGMPLDAVVRQSLMIANRCEAHSAMLAHLQRGPLVLDRYTLSGLVYGLAEGLSHDFLRNLAAPLLVPDMTVVLDIPVELVAKRRPEARDLNERDTAKLQKARDGYRSAAGLWVQEAEPPKLDAPDDEWMFNHISGFGAITAVDATQPLANVQAQVIRLVRKWAPNMVAHRGVTWPRKTVADL